jgi:signal transduction histidine kinase
MTQEEKRRVLAFELHEQSAQDLTALKIQMELLRPHCRGDEAQARLQAALMTVRVMQDQVRDMALDLHPSQLDEFGLYATLRTHSNRQANAADWNLHFEAPEDAERPPRDIELACFRVAEEALNNVARHANATEVWVSLRESGNALHLNVRDNGVGFVAGDDADGNPEKNLGLFGMAERIRQVGGRLEIKSKPGGGTEILAALPILEDSTRTDNVPAPVAA